MYSSENISATNSLSVTLDRNAFFMLIYIRVVDPDPDLHPDPDWIRIGSGFNDFVDPDPHWESGSRIRIQGQENEEK
jgi:hypothetical protein